MLTLNDGRSELWQWDTGRTVSVDADCSQVHFSNKVFGRSIDVDVVDGIAIIPDILLQTDKELTAWAFVGTAENGYTKISMVFKVNKRNKPADYVFTPPEQTTLQELVERLAAIEESQDPDAIKNAVEDYLEQNPIEAPVQSVNGQTGTVELTAEDVGAISKDELQEATNEALAQAKASGEFDGKDGVDGKDGYTPVKGKDYFDGADGKDGSDGRDGADGITPHIGANGNWFVGETDTGKPSRGADGKDGKDGAQGEQGIQGVQGDKGDKGDKGDTGATGASGKDGADGKDGTSVTVKSVSESSADGGSNMVLFSDGKTVTIKNGSKGSTGATGATGADGKTAYQYAQDGGYDGTEAEFAEKLANEYTLNPLYGKKVSFLGDSICSGGSESTSYLGGYGKIIADRNSMVYENVAHAGATVTAETYSRSTGNAKPWLCRMVENMSADADYAIIEGGINDGWDETVKANIGSITTGYGAELDDTTYYGAFESMLKQLVTKFQGKKIGYIAVPKIHSLYDSSQNAPNFYHIALECCAKWGVSVCDLNTITPPVEYLADLGTEYTADACHPTYEGYLKYYCDPIEAWMKTLITSGGNNNASVSPEVVSDINSKITALETGKLSNTGVSFRKALLPLADGTTLEIDVLTAVDGTIVIKYVNRVPISIDASGNIYNGVGWKSQLRLSASSGTEKYANDASVTGFIPVKAGDVVRFKYTGTNQLWDTYSLNLGYSSMVYYDGSFGWLGSICPNQSNVVYGICTASDTSNGSVANGGIVSFTVPSNASIAYLRLSIAINTAGDMGLDKLIVTVNQEIT